LDLQENFPKDVSLTGFPLYFGTEIQGLSRILKLHFQGAILDESLQHGQYHSNIKYLFCDYGTVLVAKNKT